MSRRHGEPPTESFDETRAMQVLREMGFAPMWRQMTIIDAGQILHRVDFVLPVRTRKRPPVLLPHHGLLVEVDGRAAHTAEGAFERDSRRETNYDALGYAWVAFTPREIERTPAAVAAAVQARLRQVPYAGLIY